RPERGNRVVAGVGFSPAARLRVDARDVGSVHLAAPLSRPSSKPRPGPFLHSKLPSEGREVAIYAGAGTRIPRPTHVVPLHSFIRTSLATCSSAAVSDSRWRRFVGCSYARP